MKRTILLIIAAVFFMLMVRMIPAEPIRNLEFETGVIIGARIVIEIMATGRQVDSHINQEEYIIERAYEIRRVDPFSYDGNHVRS